MRALRSFARRISPDVSARYQCHFREFEEGPRRGGDRVAGSSRCRTCTTNGGDCRDRLRHSEDKAGPARRPPTASASATSSPIPTRCSIPTPRRACISTRWASRRRRPPSRCAIGKRPGSPSPTSATSPRRPPPPPGIVHDAPANVAARPLFEIEVNERAPGGRIPAPSETRVRLPKVVFANRPTSVTHMTPQMPARTESLTKLALARFQGAASANNRRHLKLRRPHPVSWRPHHR